MKKTLFLILIILLSPSIAFSYAGCPYPFVSFDEIYPDQSDFVRGPAKCAGITFAMIGGTVGFIAGIPIGVIVAAAFRKGSYFGAFPFGGCIYGVCSFGNVGALVVGAPFYVLEKVFWDFPNWLLETPEKSVNKT